MPIISPKFNDLFEKAKQDLKNALGIVGVLGRTVLVPIAKVITGIVKPMYSSIVQANRNVLPDLADDESLIRHGKIRLRRPPNPAAQGEYICEVSGTIGATIDASTTFSSSTGNLYVIDSDFTLATGSDSITLRSITEGGNASLIEGQELKSTKPIPDVNTSVFVVSESVTPTKAETIEDYRVNVLQSYARQPQGGARSDYRSWTESVPGVREVYPYVRQGSPTEINLYTEAFPDDSTDGEGTPSSAILNAVRDAIEPESEPMGVAEIHYLPISLVPVDVDIIDLSDTSLSSSIDIAITAMLYEKRPYIAGDDLLTDKSKGVLTIKDIFDAVELITKDFSDIEFAVGGVILNRYEFINEEIPYLRNLTNS